MSLLNQIKGGIQRFMQGGDAQEEEDDTLQSPQDRFPSRKRKRLYQMNNSESSDEGGKRKKPDGQFRRKKEENIIKIEDTDFFLEEKSQNFNLDFSDAEYQSDLVQDLIISNYTRKKVKASFRLSDPNIFDIDVEEVTIGGVRREGYHKTTTISVTFFPLEDRTEGPVKEKLFVELTISDENVEEKVNHVVILKVYNPDGPRKRKADEYGIEGIDMETRETKRRKIQPRDLSEEEMKCVIIIQKQIRDHLSRLSRSEEMKSIIFVQSFLRKAEVKTDSDQLVFDDLMDRTNFWWGRDHPIRNDEFLRALMFIRDEISELKNLYVVSSWLHQLRRRNNDQGQNFIRFQSDPLELFCNDNFLNFVFRKFVKCDADLKEFVGFLNHVEKRTGVVMIRSHFIHSCLSMDYGGGSIDAETLMEYIRFLFSKIDDADGVDFWKRVDIFANSLYRKFGKSEEIMEDWRIEKKNIEKIVGFFNDIFCRVITLQNNNRTTTTGEEKEEEKLKMMIAVESMKRIVSGFMYLVKDTRLLLSGFNRFWRTPLSRIFISIMYERCKYDDSFLQEFLPKLDEREASLKNSNEERRLMSEIWKGEDEVRETMIVKIVEMKTKEISDDDIPSLVIENIDLFLTIFSMHETGGIKCLMKVKRLLFEYVGKLKKSSELTVGEIRTLHDVCYKKDPNTGDEVRIESFDSFHKLVKFVLLEEKEEAESEDEDEFEEEEEEAGTLESFFERLEEVFSGYRELRTSIELYHHFKSFFLSAHVERIDPESGGEGGRMEKIGGEAKLVDTKDLFSSHPFHQLFGKMREYSNSELFLQYWNRSIMEYFLKVNNDGGGDGIKNLSFSQDSQDEEFVEGGLEEDLGEGRAGAEEEGNLVRPVIPLQAPHPSTRLLKLDELKEEVLTMTVAKFTSLYNKIYHKKITLEELERTFDGFTNDQQFQKEVEHLFFINGEERKSVILNFLNLIKDAFFMISRSSKITRINLFYSVFEKRLKKVPDPIPEKEYRNKDIKEAASLLRSFKKMIIGITGEASSDDHQDNIMDLIVEISESSELINFLLKKEDNSEFNKFINVIKTITTDEFVLNCSYQLSQARSYLSCILYPTRRKIKNIQIVINRLRNCYDKNKPGEDLRKVIGVIHSSRKYLKSLECVFEKRTTSLDFQALESLIEIERYGKLIINLSQEEERRRIRCHVKNKCFEMKELREIKLLIMNSAVISEHEEKQKNKKKMRDENISEEEEEEKEIVSIRETFEELQVLVDLVQECNVILSLIKTEFSYDLFRLDSLVEFDHSSIRGNNVEIKKYLGVIKEMYTMFRESFEEFQEEYYFLNYFSSSEVCVIVKSLLHDNQTASTSTAPWSEGSEPAVLILKFLRLIDFNLSSSSSFMEHFLINKMRYESMKDPSIVTNRNLVLETIEIFGASLEEFFTQRAEKRRMSVDDEEQEEEKVQDEDIHDEDEIRKQVGVIKTEKHNVLNVVATLLPDFSRSFLICSEEDTTFEDLKRFVRRFEKSSKKYEPIAEKMFVIADVSVLSFEVLYKFINLVKKSSSDSNGCSSLFIVTSEYFNFFAPIMYDHSESLIQKSKSENLRSRFGKTLGDGKLLVVKSKIPGSGKSEHIRKIWKREFESLYHYERIPLFEKLSNSKIIDKLSSVSRRMSGRKHIFFHFDLASYVDVQVDALVFQLIHGTLRDQKTCKIFHVHEMDKMFIELSSNSIRCSDYHNNNNNTTSLPFQWGCPFIRSVLPSESLVVNEENFDPCDEMMTKLQLVCKFLARYNANDFSFFDPWDVDTIEVRECYRLIIQVLVGNNDDSEDQNPSYRLIQQMIDFLFFYFELISEYDILQFSEVAQWLKKMMMDMVINSSHEFVRSHMKIDFSEGDEEETATTTSRRGRGRRGTKKSFFNQFQSLKSWEETVRPILALNLNRDVYGKERINGFTVISLDSDWKNHIHNFESVNHWLTSQNAKIEIDFKKKFDREGLLNLIHSFEPKREKSIFNPPKKVIEIDITPEKKKKKKKKLIDEDEEEEKEEEKKKKMPFVFTKENTQKIFGILLRLKVGLPVVMIGETGVGKTYQISFICSEFGYNFHKLTIHEGVTDEEVMKEMKNIIRLARTHPHQEYLIFFDEINTRPSMKIFELIMNDRILLCCDDDDELWKFPANVKFVAALNPYRQLNSQPMGLVHPEKKNFPSNDLVYRVYPFPESFVDSIFDFGSLNSGDEEQYTISMLQSAFQNDLEKDHIKHITRKIIASHNYLRESFEEKSICSLRDIQRFIRVFSYIFNNGVENVVRKSRIVVSYRIALLFAYYSSLNRRRRREYIARMFPRSLERRKKAVRYFQKVCWLFAQKMSVDKKIALNEAFCENLFMTWLGLKINEPVLILGLPGSSKTLTTHIISKNFRGGASVSEFCRNVEPKVITIFDYQISPSTKSQNLLSIHNMAKRYHEKTNETVVLCLEELGLANVNPNHPLKVLHEIIANRGDLRLLGMSNYDLDHSNRNRFKLVFRDQPLKEDLILTANALCGGGVSSVLIQNLMSSLSSSFLEVCKNQRIPNFFGLREFYYIIRMLLKKKEEAEKSEEGEWGLETRRRDIQNSILRNFGGTSKTEEKKILEIFDRNISFLRSRRRRLSFSNSMEDENNEEEDQASTLPSEKELIVQNLKDSESRHLLVITHNNTALSLLFELKIVRPEETIVIFGSDFEEDRTDEQRVDILDAIKLGMSKGKKVVLVNCECIFEAIFDLLNQNYSEIEGKKFAKLALGHSTSSYVVKDEFRLIIIVDELDVSRSLTAPFLNRLEKRLFYRGMEGLFKTNECHRSLQMFCKTITTDTLQNESKKMYPGLIGFHAHSLESLQMAYPNSDENELKKLILLVASPEIILRISKPRRYNEYFHDDLSHLIQNNVLSNNNSNTEEKKYVVMTNTALTMRDWQSTRRSLSFCHVEFYLLHEMKKSRDVKIVIKNFLNRKSEQEDNNMMEDEDEESKVGNNRPRVLVLYADTSSVTRKQILFTQHEYEQQFISFASDTSQKRTKFFLFLIIKIPKSFQSFTFDFDHRWTYLYEDDLNSFQSYHYPISFPSSSNFRNILTNDEVTNLENLKITNLREFVVKAMSYLNYPKNIFPSQRIIQLERFYRLYEPKIRQKIVGIIRYVKYQKNNKSWWFWSKKDEDTEYESTISFKNYVYKYLYEMYCKGFACVVEMCDQNNNLRVILGDGEEEEEEEEIEEDEIVRRLYFEFFDSYSFEILSENFKLLEENHNLTVSIQQQRKEMTFPFSHLLFRHMNSYVSQKKENMEEINFQMERFFPFLVKNKEYLKLVKRYATDYLNTYGIMNSQKNKNLGPLHTIFLEKQVINFKKNKNQHGYQINFEDVQKLIWKQEPEFILIYSKLFFFMKAGECRKMMTSKNENSVDEIRMRILKKSVLEILKPLNTNIRKKWIERFHRLSPSIYGLIQIIRRESSGNESLLQEFEMLMNKYSLLGHFIFRFGNLIETKRRVRIFLDFWKNCISKIDIFSNNNSNNRNENLIQKIVQHLNDLPGQGDSCECIACSENITSSEIMCRGHKNCIGTTNKVIHQDCIETAGFAREVVDNNNNNNNYYECTSCGKKERELKKLFPKMSMKRANSRRSKFENLRNSTSHFLEDYIIEYVMKNMSNNNNNNNSGFLISQIMELVSRESVSDDFLLSESSRSSIIRRLFQHVYDNEREEEEIVHKFESCIEKILKAKKEILGHIDSDFTKTLGQIIYDMKLFKISHHSFEELNFIKTSSEAKNFIMGEVTSSGDNINFGELGRRFRIHPQLFIFFLKCLRHEKGLCYVKKYLLQNQGVECFRKWILSPGRNQEKFNSFIMCLEDDPFSHFFKDSQYICLMRYFSDHGNLKLQDINNVSFVPVILSSYDPNDDESTTTTTRRRRRKKNKKVKLPKEHSGRLQHLLLEKKMLLSNSEQQQQQQQQQVQYTRINSFFEDKSLFFRRVIVHVLCLGYHYHQQQHSGGMNYFQTLLFQPARLKGQFIPTVPSNELKEDIVKFLGRGQVWACACGYEYFVGECAQPMERKKCPGCKIRFLGGQNHQHEDGQRALGTQFTSKPNYACRLRNTATVSVEKIRDLTPKPLRVLRFVINVLLYFNSHISNDGVTGIIDPSVLPLITGNHQQQHQSQQGGRRRRRVVRNRVNENMSESEFLYRHIMNEWNSLIKIFGRSEEDVSLGIMCVISKLINLLLANNNYFPKQTRTQEDRLRFERKFLGVFSSDYFYNDVKNVQKSLQEEKDGGTDELSLEILELCPIPEFGVGEDCPRALKLPSLFFFGKSGSRLYGMDDKKIMEDFFSFCSRVDKKRYPLISHMGHRKRLDMFKNVQICLEVVKLVFKKLDRRISPNEAMTRTIGQWIASLPLDDPQRNSLRLSFVGFTRSFNSLWKDANQYECQALTDQLLIREDSPLSLLLPQPEMSGDVFSSVMMIFLKRFIDFYNEFIQKATRETYKFKVFEIPSQHIQLFDIVNYSEPILLDFIKDHILHSDHYSMFGSFSQLKELDSDVRCVLESLQYFIFKKFFSGRPTIRLEDDEEIRFEFVDSYRKKDFKKVIRKVIRQVPFSTSSRSIGDSNNNNNNNIEESKVLEVLKRLDQNKLRRLFQVVETGIQYLNKPCFINRSQIYDDDEEENSDPIFEYLKNDILIPDIENIFPGELKRSIRMSNIIPFFEILEDLLKENVFVNVSNRYKQRIGRTEIINEVKLMIFEYMNNEKEEESQNENNNRISSVKEFLKILKDFILRHFQSDSSNPEEKFIVWMEILFESEEVLGERYSWMLKKMERSPLLKQNILTKHCCHFLEIMSDCVHGL